MTMTTTMSMQQLMAKNLEMMYRMVEMNLDGMTSAQSLIQPETGGNCANWILGHLTNVHNGLMQVIGDAPVWESEQLAYARFEPVTGSATAIDWDTLKSRFMDSRARCLAKVAALSDEAMQESMPHPFGGTCTRAELLNILAFHQAYHAGQLALSRRMAGLPGAVKGPGQNTQNT